MKPRSPSVGTCSVREVVLTYSKPTRKIPNPLVFSSDVAAFADDIIGHRLNEGVIVICVNNKNRPQSWSLVGTGTPTQCVVSLADILRVALLSGASGFFLVHNHPSGDTAPSDPDVALTQRVLEASQLLGLRFLDHIIVGGYVDSPYYSFRDAERLERKT